MSGGNYSSDALLDHIFFSPPILNTSMMGEENENVNNATADSSGLRNEDLAKIEIAVLAVIFSFTVLGNIIVLAGIYFRRQKMTRMYYFILHLTLADFITAFFNVLAQLIWEVTHRFQGGNFLCKFIKYMQILGPYSSSYVLVMTALDRYQAICHPLTNSTWTANRSKWMLSLAWSFSMVFCLPQTFIFSYQEVPGTEDCDCWATFVEGGEKVYVTWYCISVFIVPLIILVFAYTCITRAIWLSFSQKSSSERRRRLKSVSDSDEDSSEIGRCNRRSQSGHGKVTFRHFQQKFRLLKSKKNGLSTAMVDPNRQLLDKDEGSIAVVVEDKGDEILSLASVTKDCGEQDRLVREIQGHKNGPEFRKNGYLVGMHNGGGANGNMASTGRNGIEQFESTFINKDGRLLPPPKKLLEVSSEGNQTKVKCATSRSKSLKRNASRKSKTRDDNKFVPRVHSVAGISRAKIKTVKLTVTIIICYIVCSSPFIGAQLWCYYDPLAMESPFYTGEKIISLFILYFFLQVLNTN